MHYVCVCKYTFLQNINDIWDVYYFPLKPQSIIYAEHSIVVKAGCRFRLSKIHSGNKRKLELE